MLYENVRIALKALWANKMRSILTTLGIIIGVASVITVVSLVQGLQHKISADLENVGSTFIRVVPDLSGRGNPFLQKMPNLTYDDALAIRKDATAIREFTPLFLHQAGGKYRDARHSALLLGVSASYQEVVNHWVDRGRFFTPLDEEANKRVTVLGPEAARLLELDDPLGKVIQIDGNSYTVIGVMEKRGSSVTGNPDDVFYIPFHTARVIYGRDEMLHLPIALQVRNREDVDLAKEQVRDILRNRHHLAEDAGDDFQISTQEELMKTISKVLNSTSLIMAAVVGIALLVGGIGIMNIMLVSVTERTREIGIRKSMGARRQDVLVQFLIEAIALSGVGGVMGLGFGVLLANAVRMGIARWVEFPPVHTPLWAVVLSLGFCGILGVIFGIYPAAKAAKLDPIESLRYE